MIQTIDNGATLQSWNSMFADKNSMEFAKQNIDTSGKLMLQVGYVFI